MYSKELYNKLKQTNVSLDKEKTRERVKALWNALEKNQKQEVLNISDLKKATVERTGREGNLSVRLATALAEISRVDPYYLAAITDEMQANVPDSTIESFLIDHKYHDLVREFKRTVYYRPDYAGQNRYAGRDAAAPAGAPARSASISQIASEVSKMLTDDEKASLESMGEDDMINLLRAVNLRARFNDEAKSVSILLKKILIG